MHVVQLGNQFLLNHINYLSFVKIIKFDENPYLGVA